jgi:DNA-binding response OmpR family regulator
MEPIDTLVIDDEKVICEGCRLALSEKGHSVRVCKSGKEGLDAILGGNYEVTLLDMKLPDMDCMDILRTLKQ